MFLAQAVTIVLAIIVVLSAIVSAGQKNKKSAEGHIEIINLSEEIEEVKEGMLKEIMSEEEYKIQAKEHKKQHKAEEKKKKKALKLALKQKKQKEKEEKEKESSNGTETSDEKSALVENSDVENSNAKIVESTDDSQTEHEVDKEAESKPRLFVLNFDGDVEASAVENLREEISAIVSASKEGDKVLLRLESPGGMVHSYGLAASQLQRLKQAGLELTIAVDQVAASGGYMMACTADKIVAAPFAVVGSIGVVAEIPNFHRLLKHNKVDYEQHTAGEFKRTLTMFAENSEEARSKFKSELEETHVLFKEFIIQNRPSLDIEKVATGEHWYGSQALKLGLIDEVMTSDDIILEAAENSDIFEINYEVKKPLSQRLSFSLQSMLEKAFLSIWQRSLESRLFKG